MQVDAPCTTFCGNIRISPRTRKATGDRLKPEQHDSTWLADFEAAARRPLKTRLRYAFIHTYKPVMDDAPYRSFDRMQDYRDWCAKNLPEWLGYGCV